MFYLFYSQEQLNSRAQGDRSGDSVLVPEQTVPFMVRGGNKVYRFMFVYKGPDFDPAIIAEFINKMNSGVFSGDMKYCILSARVSAHLDKLYGFVVEYNRRVEPGNQITLVSISDYSGKYLPLVMQVFTRSSNPVQHKHEYDRRTNGKEIRIWKRSSA